MNDAAPRTLGSYIRVKHGCAFKGEYFTEAETPDVLVTPGNFAIGGGFLADKPKYYAGADDERGAMKVVVTGTNQDPEPLRNHVRTKAARKLLAERFKAPHDDLRLVIVCDM